MRSLLAGSLFAAVFTGAFKSADAGSVWSGIGPGMAAGLGYGLVSVLIGQHHRDVLLPDLSDSDREKIMRTVREGSLVTESRLAPAVIAYTEALRIKSSERWETPGAERSARAFLESPW